MSFSSLQNRIPHTGNGSASQFSFPFRIKAETDLRVTTRVLLTGVEELLTLGDDYTVAGVGLKTGGSITLTAGALPATQMLVIRRIRPLTQLLDVSNQAKIYPEVYEGKFDDLVMIDQAQQDEIDRSLKLPESIDPATFDMRLPALLEANRTLTIDAAGTGLALGPTPAELTEASANLVATEAARDAAIAAQVAAEAAQQAAEDAAAIADTSADAAAASAASALASADSAAESELEADLSAQDAADSAADAAASAASIVPVPAGGTTGQVLKKQSNADGDVNWEDESGGGGGSLTWEQERLTGTFAAGNTTYTLSHAPSSAKSLNGFLGSVPQLVNTDFTLSGTTVTFPGEDTTDSEFLAIYPY